MRTFAVAVGVAALALAACTTSDSQRNSDLPALNAVKGDPGQSVDRLRITDKKLDDTKIAIIGFANNPFWDPLIAGAKAAGSDLAAHGATVDYITAGATLDVPTVERAVDSAVSQGYDAIGVVPLADGSCPSIKRAVGKKVPVATLVAEGNCSKEAGSLFFRGQPALEAGAKAAGAMAQATGCKGSVGVITGSFSVQQHEERRRGFEDAYKKQCPAAEIVGPVENGDDAGKALNQANDFMTANPDLRGIYVTAGGPFGAAQAVQQSGKAGKVAVIGYDFVPQNVDLVRKGVMQAAIGQDPYGAAYNTAVELFNHLAGEAAPQEYFQPVNVAVMTKDNIDAVLSTQTGK